MTMSPFRAAAVRAEADLDAHLADRVQITPMRNGDFARVPDAQRPAFDVMALVAAGEPTSVDIPKFDSRAISEVWHVDILRAELAGRRIRKGDEVILLDWPGSPRLVVSYQEPGDADRVCLVCGPVADD
jgi:hypothetical protein